MMNQSGNEVTLRIVNGLAKLPNKMNVFPYKCFMLVIPLRLATITRPLSVQLHNWSLLNNAVSCLKTKTPSKSWCQLCSNTFGKCLQSRSQTH